ncbi:F-box/FBD/LRR-repeat protein-like protein [Tanacetum coccineum]
MDRISNLPLRTSTLSKEWRYHWTNVTKIVVIEDTLNRSKLLCGVGQALLMHKGPIHEVTLSVVSDYRGFDVAIDRIISNLSSKKAVKKLRIDFVSRRHKPRFSRLKRRRKGQTSWSPKKRKKQTKPSNGFGSLTCLCLENSKISIKTLLYLLSTCPFLKTVALRTNDFYDYDGVTYTNLFESLMLIESLTIWCKIIAVLAALAPHGYYSIIPQKVPTALVHLKYLCIEGLHFGVHNSGIRVISLLSRSSPNLEKLKLNIMDGWHGNDLSWSLSLEDYADIWLEHLSELEITYLSSEKIELDIVKLILMRSPVLKKLRIFISKKYKDKELQISETLLSSPHASPVVEFIVENEPY